VELVEEFIAAAHRADAEVDFVTEGSTLLEEGNGVGALSVLTAHNAGRRKRSATEPLTESLNPMVKAE
jgi:hypothetical protein